MTSKAFLACALAGSMFLAGCGGDDAASTGSTSSSGSGGGGGAGGMAPCAADEHRADDGSCDTTIGWTSGPDLAIARDHHATFVVDGGSASKRFLYVAGGFSKATNAMTTNVTRASIADDGTLGAWEDVDPLPEATAGMGVVVSHGMVVLAGGFMSQTTWTAPVGADGSVGAWKQGPDLTYDAFHTASVAYGDSVYVVGGLDVTQTLDLVQRAKFTKDGIGEFVYAAKLPYTLSHHTAVLDGATLYVIGGQTGNPNDNSGLGHRDVLIATIAEDGTIGAWSNGPELPQPTMTHASAVHDGFLYVIGGIVDTTESEASGIQTANVQRARILAPGMLGPWEVDTASQMPRPRSHVHQAPVFGSTVYSVSGEELGFTTDTPAVDVGSFH